MCKKRPEDGDDAIDSAAQVSMLFSSLARERCTSADGCINKSTIERIHF